MPHPAMGLIACVWKLPGEQHPAAAGQNVLLAINLVSSWGAADKPS